MDLLASIKLFFKPAPAVILTTPTTGTKMASTAYNIPNITPAELKARAKRIKPIVRYDSQPFWIKPCSLVNTAFTWDPKPTKAAHNLEPIVKIRTLHIWAYYGFFKPTIEEVLAQIPEEYLAETAAFETIGPSTVEDINRERDALNAGFHVAETTLYRLNGKPLPKFGAEPINADFRDLVKQAKETLDEDKVVKICGSKKDLNDWAAGVQAPIKPVLERVKEDLEYALEDFKSDPTIQPGEQVLELIRKSCYIVRVNDSDHFNLWCRYVGDHGSMKSKLLWDERGQGWIQPIGKWGGSIIEVRVFSDTLNGKKVCFVEPVSEVVHHGMVRKWIDRHRGKTPDTNADNFHLAVHAAMESK